MLNDEDKYINIQVMQSRNQDTTFDSKKFLGNCKYLGEIDILMQTSSTRKMHIIIRQ